MWSEKESVRSSTANFLNDEEVRAMAIFHGIPGGMDIHAGITEEGDPSREQWQEDEEPRIPHQSTPTSLPVTSKKRTKKPYENVFTVHSTFPTLFIDIYI